MKIRRSLLARIRSCQAAFSLAEATVGMGIVGMLVAAILSGFTSGIFTMHMARENLRATQIMLERMETIRLYSWDQVNSNGFITTNFTAKYDPDPNAASSGVIYNGFITISPVPLASSYSNDMKLVTVRVEWTTGAINRSREFSSYISRDGLQNYIY